MLKKIIKLEDMWNPEMCEKDSSTHSYNWNKSQEGLDHGLSGMFIVLCLWYSDILLKRVRSTNAWLHLYSWILADGKMAELYKFCNLLKKRTERIR